jgi:hypothetical protein
MIGKLQISTFRFASLTRGTYVMVVNPSVPTQTVPEFIAYAKDNPGKVAMASAGTGSGPPRRRRAVQGDDRHQHASRAVSGRCTRTLRPARGTGPTLLQHPAWIDRVGKLRALAVTTATRSEALPDIRLWASSCRAMRRASGSGNAASDTSNVTPSAVATFIDGGDPVGQLPATSHHPQTERQK